MCPSGDSEAVDVSEKAEQRDVAGDFQEIRCDPGPRSVDVDRARRGEIRSVGAREREDGTVEGHEESVVVLLLSCW